MNIMLLSILLTITLFLHRAASTHDFDGIFNGIWDIYISCAEQPVPNPTNGLPQNYSPQVYTDAIELCSALNSQAPSTVGCVCSSDQVNSLHCHPEIADPQLYHAVYAAHVPRLYNTTFPQYCRQQCICRPAMESETRGRDDPTTPENLGGSAFESPFQSDKSNHSAANNAESSSENTASGASTDMDIQSVPWTHEEKPGQVSHDQCGRNCTTNSECKAGCMCSVQSERYQPGKGTVAFLAACIISMAGKKIPRGIEDGGKPCACNSTYVSYACCSAPDGLVWEKGAFKLGELLLEGEL